MNGDKREVVTNAILGFASLIVAAAIIFLLSEQSGRYERDAADRARHYARDAESKIASECRIRVPDDAADCVDQAVDSARENQRKEQDLAAQWVTAWWTKVTGGAAVFGVILSAFGIFLVWRTFRATSESNAIASATADTDLRPWLEIDPFVDVHDTFTLTDRLTNVSFKLTIKNIGKTPAKDVHVEARLFNLRDEYDGKIAAFFEGDFRRRGLPRAILPQGSIMLRLTAQMRRDAVRISTNVTGRNGYVSLILAVRVIYGWRETGAGQTAASYGIARKKAPHGHGWIPMEIMGEETRVPFVFRERSLDNVK